MTGAVCARCQRPQSAWSIPGGFPESPSTDRVRYCCEGCARDSGCVCETVPSAEAPDRNALLEDTEERSAGGPSAEGM